MSTKQTFQAKTLQDAIAEAASFFQVDPAFVCYELANGSSSVGLLSKLFSRGVKIEAWVEKDREDLQQEARKMVQEVLKHQAPLEKKDLSEKEKVSSPIQRPSLTLKDERAQEVLKEYNERFFSAFGVSPEAYSFELQNEDMVVRVTDESIETLLSKSDKLALAYEHIYKRVVQKKAADTAGRVFLQAGESDEKHKERLSQIAQNLAEKVKKTGRSIVVSSKSSQERRTIHLALDGYEGIGTRSVGPVDKRRLVIFSTVKKSSAENKKNQNNSEAVKEKSFSTKNNPLQKTKK